MTDTVRSSACIALRPRTVPGWLGFFCDLVARGLLTAGPVGLVTSDADTGLVAAIGATLPAPAGNAAAPTTQPT